MRLSGVYNEEDNPIPATEIDIVIRLCLPPEEAERLDRAFRQESDPKVKDRLLIVRLAQRGRPHQEIARDLAVTPRTVQRWLNAYLERGLAGLARRNAPVRGPHARRGRARPPAPGGKPPGRRPATPDAWADDVRRWVIEGPTKQGLDRAGWTHAELADHLLKARGLRASRAAVGRFCRRI